MTLDTPGPTSSKTPGGHRPPHRGARAAEEPRPPPPRPEEPGPPLSPPLPAAPHQPSTSFWELGSTPSPSSLPTSSASPSAAASRSLSCSSRSSEALLIADIPGARGRYTDPRPLAALRGAPGARHKARRGRRPGRPPQRRAAGSPPRPRPSAAASSLTAAAILCPGAAGGGGPGPGSPRRSSGFSPGLFGSEGNGEAPVGWKHRAASAGSPALLLPSGHGAGARAQHVESTAPRLPWAPPDNSQPVCLWVQLNR